MVGEENGVSPEAINYEKAWKKAETLMAQNISVELGLSASGYLLTLLIGAFGARLIKVD